MRHSHIAFLGGRVRFNAENVENSHKFHERQRVKKAVCSFKKHDLNLGIRHLIVRGNNQDFKNFL
jgi:hypothetical protein